MTWENYRLSLPGSGNSKNNWREVVEVTFFTQFFKVGRHGIEDEIDREEVRGLRN